MVETSQLQAAEAVAAASSVAETTQVPQPQAGALDVPLGPSPEFEVGHEVMGHSKKIQADYNLKK